MINTNLIDTLRSQNPLIHNITNIVVANYVANGLLAIGASPIMSSAIEEMDELACICSAISINIGTLTSDQIDAMLVSGKAANHYGKPVILDPVGVGATTFRQQSVKKLLEAIKFTVIRGNAGEMAYLADIDWQAKGVDAGEGNSDLSEIAKGVAKKYNTVAVISGKVDYVSDGNKAYAIDNGSDLFPLITGSGCLHGAICAAFISLGVTDTLSAVASACVSYAVAGELAAKEVNASGTFIHALINALSTVKASDIATLSNVRELS